MPPVDLMTQDINMNFMDYTQGHDYLQADTNCVSVSLALDSVLTVGPSRGAQSDKDLDLSASRQVS